MPTVGNRTAISSTTRCAIIAHVVQAPDPLQQHRTNRKRATHRSCKVSTEPIGKGPHTCTGLAKSASPISIGKRERWVGVGRTPRKRITCTLGTSGLRLLGWPRRCSSRTLALVPALSLPPSGRVSCGRQVLQQQRRQTRSRIRESDTSFGRLLLRTQHKRGGGTRAAACSTRMERSQANSHPHKNTVCPHRSRTHRRKTSVGKERQRPWASRHKMDATTLQNLRQQCCRRAQRNTKGLWQRGSIRGGFIPHAPSGLSFQHC
jgi:hypothetical protein